MKIKNSKSLYIILLILLFIVFVIYYNFFRVTQNLRIDEVISPVEIRLNNSKIFHLNNYNTFDAFYSENNKVLAKTLDITEDEAFILGNLGKYWTKNMLDNRKVKYSGEDLIYNRYGYKIKFENSPYAVKNGKILNEYSFHKQIDAIRKGNYVILNLNNDIFYPVSKENAEITGNFVVVKKSHIKNSFIKNIFIPHKSENTFDINNISSARYNSILDLGNIKIIVSDLTTKIFPDRKCSSDICKEILENINHTQKTLDMAIYGYSSIPEIETAIKNAQKRGVKIRVVYDLDGKNQNIYPDTLSFIKLFSYTNSDNNSIESAKIMHNKFYIFDNKTVITGSANLSHTDMSGFNSNSIIVINSPKIAEIYKKEFEQMLSGKFHNDKTSFPSKEIDNIKIYFSPQDKSMSNGILPLIKNAEKYIYIPAFIITHKDFVKELISAKDRGVDVKIIIDSLNASGSYSRHTALRSAGIPVKAENYAGKMHSKAIIIDDKYLVIGSMNFSSSGENKNDENIAILNNPEASRFYRDFFLYQWKRIPDKWLNRVPRAEGKESIGSCSDGLDNNYDGLTDNMDEGCKEN